MRTAKCLVIVLVSAVVFGAERRVSNTRQASCIVRITADREIIPLNPQTVSHLIHSSAVVGKAAREVLGLGVDATAQLGNGIEIEWLAQAVGPIVHPPEPRIYGGKTTGSTGQSRREGHSEMARQLAELHDDRYVEKLPSEDSDPTKADAQTDAPGMMMGGMGGMMGGGGMSGGMGGMMGGGGMGGGMGGMMGGGGMGGGMGGMSSMGGMGGMMGGMGGMSGMGGIGGMGGMMGGMYGGPVRAAPAGGAQQNATLRFSVRLPEDAQPAAKEFLAALVENLRVTLSSGYQEHVSQLETLTDLAEARRRDAETSVEIVMGIRSPERQLIEGHLNTIVDLSILSPEMPFSEAIEHLRNAVEPPLQIVVLWKELLESCEIEPTTPIDMDGLPQVKLETALKVLIEAVSGGFSDISYQIEDDVIVIREEELQEPQAVSTGLGAEADVRGLAARRRELARRLQQLDMGFAMTEARRAAIERQIIATREETAQRMEADSVIREMQNLVEMSQAHLETLTKRFQAGSLGATEVATARENLTRAKIELARRREELANAAGGGQLKEFNSELSRMAIDTAEKRAELEFLRRQLAETEDQLAQASTFDPRAARIRTAREALDLAEAHVTRLRARLASLQPPTVTVIGAD
ncbi:MAG: hypothetical protein JSW27_14435 [Phycisphaerales bacterium]|nr:MAG: hypothetical protein JSW27_14435 [Phycisphaerales bacterium]